MIEGKRAGIIPQDTVLEGTFAYEPQTIDFTLINFFFGQNGTGKTTISDTITKLVPETYECNLFNHEFVERNMSKVKDGSGLNSVFVLDEENRKINEEVKKKRNDAAELRKQALNLRQQKENQKKENNKALGKLRDKFNEKSKDDRNLFINDFLPRTYTSKTENLLAALADHKEKMQRNPKDFPAVLDINEILEYRKSTENKAENRKIELKPLTFNYDLDKANKILSEPIVPIGDSQFREFLKRLGAENWFRDGKKFQNLSNGLCPYCQQPLPANFEEMVKEAFDDTYESMRASLKKAGYAYDEAVATLLNSTSSYKDPKRWADEKAYKEYIIAIDAFEKILQDNKNIFTQKSETPVQALTLVSFDEELKQLNSLIESNNAEVRTFNANLENTDYILETGRNMLYSYLCYAYADDIKAIDEKKAEIKSSEATMDAAISKAEADAKVIEAEADEKSKTAKDTSQTVKAINDILKSSGFTGFHIEEVDKEKHTVQIIRESTGKPAVKLSEGEKNFIMFLYFFFNVKGTTSSDGVRKDKIVIIDDPVTSMDSQALFVISTLTKELIAICAHNYDTSIGLNGDDYIKQFFFFTHNPFFFRDVTDRWIEPFEHVSYFSVTKIDNKSHVELCKKQKPSNRSVWMNDIPVKNAYNYLWTQYNNSTDSNILMSVCRQILNHYFIQTCSFTGDSLAEALFNKDNDEILKYDDAHNPDMTTYHIVQALISFLSLSMEDDYNFDLSAIGADIIKGAFRKVFIIMKHQQHYDEMIKLG